MLACGPAAPCVASAVVGIQLYVAPEPAVAVQQFTVVLVASNVSVKGKVVTAAQGVVKAAVLVFKVPQLAFGSVIRISYEVEGVRPLSAYVPLPVATGETASQVALLLALYSRI